MREEVHEEVGEDEESYDDGDEPCFLVELLGDGGKILAAHMIIKLHVLKLKGIPLLKI